MPIYDVAGYVTLSDHPDIVTGIILRDKETSIKVKMSVEKTRDLYLNNQICVSPEENLQC